MRKKKRQFQHLPQALPVRLLPAGLITGLQKKSSAAHTGPHRCREHEIPRQHVNGHDRLRAATARGPSSQPKQIKSSSSQTANAAPKRHGKAYLFPAAPPPHARRRCSRSRGQAPRAQAALHPRALRLHIPRRRRAQAAPHVAPRRQASTPGGHSLRCCCSLGGAAGGGWPGTWCRVHHQPQLLPEGDFCCSFDSALGDHPDAAGAAIVGAAGAGALPPDRQGGRHDDDDAVQVGAAGQRVDGVPGGVPAHAVGAGPPGGAGAAVHRAVQGGERGGGRALGLRPRRRPGPLRPPLPRPQGPPPHRGHPHLEHPRRRAHAARHRRARHPRGQRGAHALRRRAGQRHRWRPRPRPRPPPGSRQGDDDGGRQDEDQLRHVRHRDRPRPAAGRAHDDPAGARPPVARRRRRVPRHVPRRDGRLHGELHRLPRLVYGGAQGQDSTDHREAHVGRVAARHIHGACHPRQPVLRNHLVLTRPFANLKQRHRLLLAPIALFFLLLLSRDELGWCENFSCHVLGLIVR